MVRTVMNGRCAVRIGKTKRIDNFRIAASAIAHEILAEFRNDLKSVYSRIRKDLTGHKQPFALVGTDVEDAGKP